ncbi:unnamed protein product [Closterium sp. NIES-64]|nr:unnamed protein product [Closterium sp. NIES-64]
MTPVEPLAENRTRRVDPLQHFQYYEGGWDPSSKDYWARLQFYEGGWDPSSKDYWAVSASPPFLSSSLPFFLHHPSPPLFSLSLSSFPPSLPFFPHPSTSTPTPILPQSLLPPAHSPPISPPTSPITPQSVAWAGIYGLVVGAAWVVLGISILAFALCACLFCRKRWKARLDGDQPQYTPFQIRVPLAALLLAAVVILCPRPLLAPCVIQGGDGAVGGGGDAISRLSTYHSTTQFTYHSTYHSTTQFTYHSTTQFTYHSTTQVRFALLVAGGVLFHSTYLSATQVGFALLVAGGVLFHSTYLSATQFTLATTQALVGATHNLSAALQCSANTTLFDAVIPSKAILFSLVCSKYIFSLVCSTYSHSLYSYMSVPLTTSLSPCNALPTPPSLMP